MTELVLVTGGSRGIGAAICRALAATGVDIGLNYLRNRDAAVAVQSDVEAQGVRCELLQADVADEQQVQSMFRQLDASLGTLTGLVNNAGILETQGRLEDMDAARIDRVMRTNVTGSFLCAREAVRRMSVRHGGRGGAIVNVSSAASRLGSPGEYIDYAASKGAIDSMTIGLSKEVGAEGIRVNAVRPGVIYTDIHASGGEPGRVDRVGPGAPLARGGYPEEVAAAVVWLLSDAASYTTGSFIEVSGGR